MKIVPYIPEHAVRIRLQAAQAEVAGMVGTGYADALSKAGEAYSVLNGEEVIFCGGVANIWPGRSMLWSLLSETANKHMLFLTRGVRRFILLQSGRIETIVRADFQEGHRWAKLCGLNWHHHEEKYLPGGFDADIYVRFC